VSDADLRAYVLRLGDDHLILGQRLAEWTGRAPTLEEELSLANLSLDCFGQARSLLSYAAELAPNTDEDQLAFLRLEHEYTNVLLVEHPNEDFAFCVGRQLYFSAFMLPYWYALTGSADSRLAAIAGQAVKEAKYHLRHAREWTLRLGDGTEDSHRRMQVAIDDLWPFTGELFEVDDLSQGMLERRVAPDASALRPQWDQLVAHTLSEATLEVPQDRSWFQTGGRAGVHTEHLGHLLAEMQAMQRTYPGLEW
jgi:ring-1,2-phenylacetyl-CoA epoxidase subunit PaaC